VVEITRGRRIRLLVHVASEVAVSNTQET